VVGLEDAKRAGIEGVQIEVGNAAEQLRIADPQVRAGVKEQMRRTGLPVCSLMMGLLNSQPLATDPRAPAWLEQSIDAAKDLGARVILVAFFGNGDLLDANEKVKEADVDVVVQRLKAAAPRAKEAGVILGIENYLNGEQNERILDRVKHESVQHYFDVYNTGTTKHHNVPADIRRLKGRIAHSNPSPPPSGTSVIATGSCSRRPAPRRTPWPMRSATAITCGSCSREP
jgi:sugar phosphate isomerase/epimerase